MIMSRPTLLAVSTVFANSAIVVFGTLRFKSFKDLFVDLKKAVTLV